MNRKKDRVSERESTGRILTRLNIRHGPSSYFTPLSSTQGKVSNIERKWGKGRCVKKLGMAAALRLRVEWGNL